MNKTLLLSAGIIALAATLTTLVLATFVIPAAFAEPNHRCSGNPHDNDDSGNPHDFQSGPNGNPHQGGHHFNCPGQGTDQNDNNPDN